MCWMFLGGGCGLGRSIGIKSDPSCFVVGRIVLINFADLLWQVLILRFNECGEFLGVVNLQATIKDHFFIRMLAGG